MGALPDVTPTAALQFDAASEAAALATASNAAQTLRPAQQDGGSR